MPDEKLTAYRGGKALRRGWTTGSCAAAASQAAAVLLLTGIAPPEIHLHTPGGITFCLPVEDAHMSGNAAVCTVRKDSGDDPDITNGVRITASVRRIEKGVTIEGGAGVGRITRPGLAMPVGEAAINPGPRQQIADAVHRAAQQNGYGGGFSVTISVKDGEALAAQTYNGHLGIVGGISILGTSGIVEPMSEQALLDTIHVELRQRRESGADYVLLAPGNYGADYIRDFLGLDSKSAVLTSNFIGDSLELCKELGFRGALLIGHIGKLVKLAGGMWNTHSKFGDCRMEIIAAHSAALGLGSAQTEEILHCATCDAALRILDEAGRKDAFLARLGQRIGVMLAGKGGALACGAILFSKEYGFLCETEGAEELLKQIREG